MGRVIDCLSERSYQDAVDWQKIYPRWNVLHRVFEKRAGRGSLANLGVFVRHIVQDPAVLHQIRPDEFIVEPNFPEPDRIAFESHLRESPLLVARD